MSLMSRKLTLSGQHSKQLIHDVNHSNAQNKLSVRSVLPVKFEYFETNLILLFFCSKFMICYINLLQYSLLK